MKKQHVTPADLPDYFNSAVSWETDRVRSAKKQARLAWIVAGLACLTALGAVGSVAALAPLKTVEPYVIRVDSATGIPDIITALTEEKFTYDEAVDKYFLAKYLIHRERWLSVTHEVDYRTVGIMSSPAQASKFVNWYQPSNPSSPMNIYAGNNVSCSVKIKNISFLEEGVALIRFTKEVQVINDTSISHWMATVAYDYSAGEMLEQDRLISPLGFQVREYRIDPETVQGG